MQCGSCFKETSISPCIECRTLEATRKNTDILSKQASDTAARQRDEARRQQDMLASIESANVMAQIRQNAANRRLEELESNKLTELQKQTRILEEAPITPAEAYDEGYSWQWAYDNPEALENSLDEDGHIFQLHYENPYVSSRLHKQFEKGVWARLKEEIGDDLMLNAAEMAKVAYNHGAIGADEFTVYQPVPFLKDLKFTLEVNYDVYDSTLLDTGEWVMKAKQSFIDLADEEPNNFKIAYITGLNKHINEWLTENNTEELMKQRAEEIVAAKIEKQRQAAAEVQLALDIQRQADWNKFSQVFWIITALSSVVLFIYIAPWYWTALIGFVLYIWAAVKFDIN